MGTTSSRPTLRKQTSTNENASPNNDNFRRSSKTRMSKSERANAISLNLQNIKSQIEQFDGFRGDPRYQSIQSQLTAFSQEIQEVKTKSKTATKDICSNIQADIVDLLRRLEEIVEKNENELDLAAVHSHSFIDQTPSLKKKEVPVPEQEPRKSVHISSDTEVMNITELEESTSNLMKEINRAIELQSTSEFVVFEKKIGILYSDLTTIDIDKNHPLYERKESISRKLIRYNNKLKTYKNRDSEIVDKEAEKQKQVEQELQIINQVEESLVDLELKVMLFEDVKSDPKYRELDQALKGYWAKLQGLSDGSEENRRKKLKTINLIKKNLQALSSKAEENNNKLKAALEKINNLEEEVFVWKAVVNSFQGYKNDLDYTNIDQTIRSLWAKLNDIHSAYSKVEHKKNEIIKTIQNMLTTLSQNAEKYEAKVAAGKEKQNSQSVQSRKTKTINNDNLVGQLNDFENRWKRLSQDIAENLTIENQSNVEIILTTIQSDMDKCIKELPSKLIDSPSQTLTRNSNQNQKQVNKSSTDIIKTKEEKFKSRTTTDFQPQEMLIEELITSLPNKSPVIKPSRSASVEQIIDKIETLQDKLKNITEEINNSSPNQHEEMRSKLQQVENELHRVGSNPSPVVTESKADVLNTIQDAYKLIEEKSKKESKEDTAKLKTIVENLQRVKKKVDCFSGTYGNIQFVQIEKELNDCLLALDDIDCKDNQKIQNNKKQIQQKINHYLNILDERSLKVSSQEDLTIESEKEKFQQNTNKLIDKLTEIRTKLEQYEENKSNDFEGDFQEAKTLLETLAPVTQDDNNKKDYYTDYLGQLITYYKSKLTDIPSLMDLEKIVQNVKHEASELGNVMMDNQNINQRISTILNQIRKVQAHGEAEEIAKAKLMNDIRIIADLLKTKESIQKDLDQISTEIDKFSGPNFKKTYDTIDEKLSAIFLKVQEIPVSSGQEYVQLRNNLIKKVQNYKKRLNDRMKTATEADSDQDGTEI